MASNTDVVKKNYTITCLYYVSISVSVCLLQTQAPYENQIFKIPITFYNARRQQSSRTVEVVDHTYDGRRVARRTHTSVDRSALTALGYFDLVRVCCAPCSYNGAAVDKIFLCRGPICVTLPNFIKIGQTVAEIWQFNGFHIGGRPPFWILEIQIF